MTSNINTPAPLLTYDMSAPVLGLGGDGDGDGGPPGYRRTLDLKDIYSSGASMYANLSPRALRGCARQQRCCYIITEQYKFYSTNLYASMAHTNPPSLNWFPLLKAGDACVLFGYLGTS